MMKSTAVSLILFVALVQAQNVARLKADSREFFLFTFLREQLVRSNKPRETLRPHIENGVTFSRSFTQLPKNSNFYLQFNDNHCASSDAYGNNACHFNWGETMMGNYSISLPISIDVGDSMTGHFMIDGFIPYEFTCQLCGVPCVLTIPIINSNHTFPMPDCPLPRHIISQQIEYSLDPYSPTDGIQAHIEGNIKVIAGNGTLFADFSVSAYVK